MVQRNTALLQCLVVGFEETTLPALDLDQESRDSISHLSRVYSLSFALFLSQRGKVNHALPGYQTLYLITQLHGKTSL